MNRENTAKEEISSELQEITISEIVDILDLQHLQDLFASAHGVASIITDTSGKPITQPSNFTHLCEGIIRKTEKGLANCFNSDAVIGSYNQSGPVVQPCLSCGLWDAGVSITVGGRYIANWLIGQVRNEQIDEEQMMQYAREIDADRGDFKAALKEVPIMSADKFHKIAELLFVFANELSERAFTNVLLKKQINDNKQMNAILLEREENLTTTLNSIGDGVISTDKEGLIVNMNPVAEKLCGWMLAEALGKPLISVFNIVNSDTGEAIDDPVKRVLQSGETAGMRNHKLLCSKKGAEYHITDKAAPIRNKEGAITGAVMVISDVSETYETQKMININEGRFRGLLENLETGIIVHAPDTSVIVINPRASELLGLNSDQVNRKKSINPAWNFVGEDNNPLLFEEYPVNKIISTGKPIKKQILGIHRRGKKDIIWVTINGFPVFDQGGSISEIVISFIDISERKEAVNKLIVSEKKLKEAQRIAHLGNWELNIQTNKLFWSDEIFRIFDCRPQEFKATYEAFLEFIHPDDREKVNSAYLNSLETKKEYQIEHRIITKNNQLKFVREKCSTTFNEKGEPLNSFGIVTDITKQKQIEVELAESVDRFKALHNASFGGIAIHDKGLILECNQGLSDMTGYSQEELIGMDGLLLIAPEYREKVMKNIVSGNEKPYEADGLRKNGEQFPMLLEARNIPYKGKDVRTVEFRDITESKNYEKVIIRQERLSAIGELASGVAHDFNNVLQIIMGGVEMALVSEEPDELNQYLESIKNSASDAASRVRQLQRFAQKNQSQKENVSIDINDLIDDVIKEVKLLLNQYQEKGIHITIQSDYQARGNIEGNEGELRTCLVNLIKNSAEAMPEGGKIAISTSEYDSQIYVMVADTGAGMDRDTQKKIFQPFYSTKGFEPGRGLGMAQVYSTIRDHNGDIYIKESEIGKGTIMEFTLPCSDRKEVPEEKGEEFAGSIRILWVDDEEMILNLGEKMLKKLGHRADLASSGAEALEYLARGEEYNLVITDVGMPGMSGWQLAEQIKKEGYHTEIAILTGWGTEVSHEDKGSNNIGYVLGKPLTLKDLKGLINEVLGSKADYDLDRR